GTGPEGACTRHRTEVWNSVGYVSLFPPRNAREQETLHPKKVAGTDPVGVCTRNSSKSRGDRPKQVAGTGPEGACTRNSSGACTRHLIERVPPRRRLDRRRP